MSLAVALFLAARSRAAEPVTDFAKSWSIVETSIKSRYYARKSREKEMTQLLRQYGFRARRSTSRAEFSGTVNKMIGEFKDSHFSFLSNDDQGYYLMDSLTSGMRGAPMPNVGAWFTPAPGGYRISMCLEGGAAAMAGLRQGDLLTNIEGRPISPVACLRGLAGKTVDVTYLRGADMRVAKLKVAEADVLSMFYDASVASEKVVERGGHKFGYIHLWTMANPKFSALLRQFVLSGKAKGTEGLIYDIRDGFGGRPEGFFEAFYSPQVTITWNFSGTESQETLGYAKPVVLVVNRGSRSAKEVVSAIFKDSKRALLVGNTTAGNVLGTSPIKVLDWAYLEIPMVDVAVDGVRLEAKGVEPDIVQEDGFDADGHDLVFERAVTELSTKLGISQKG